MLDLIGRDRALFSEDLAKHGDALDRLIAESRFLVVGGAGSIGNAVVRELFVRNPRRLHVVDINENGLAELVRDLRSSVGYIDGDFHAYAIDCLGPEFSALMDATEGYDYVLNFSALKHVRSEKDPYTLMRMIDVNVFGTQRTIDAAIGAGACKFFCVSTDKAANPVNMMGGSKRIMEMYLARASESIQVSTARFANVAFSNGSLPFSWTQRIKKRQPLVAPRDIRRYFVTEQEGATLCLFSALLGDNCDIFFPKLSEKLHLITFSDMADRYLRSIGYDPVCCENEQEARDLAAKLPDQGKWPVYYFDSDTTGEKDFEEFYTSVEQVDWDRYHEIGIVKSNVGWDETKLDRFTKEIQQMRCAGSWQKTDILELFGEMLDTFSHKESGKFLDQKM